MPTVSVTATRANQSARACLHSSAEPNADASANAAVDCLTLAIAHAAAVCRAHTVSYAVVKSSQVNTLPKAKSQAKDKRAKDRQ